MYISVKELNNLWNIKPTGVVHVGAHIGEEAADYKRHSWSPVIWVEAQPSLVAQLRSKLDPETNEVIEAAVWNESGVDLELHIASNSQSTSLLDFGSHQELYPHIIFTDVIKVKTKRLEDLLTSRECPNFINLDLQGVELQALEGLGKLIEVFDYVYTEVNKIEVYKNCTRVSELDKFLGSLGFARVTTRWTLGHGWGDALYIRNQAKKRKGLAKQIKYQMNSIFFYIRQILVCLKPL